MTAEAASVEQTYTGVVRARYETDLAFRVGAKITARHVEVGQRVAAGAVLFRLDPTDYRLAVKAAEADLTAGEAEVVQAAAEYDRQLRATRTYQARFTIQNPGPKVVLGMTATVHLAPAAAARGYVLPLSSLLRTGDRPSGSWTARPARSR